MTRIRSKWFFGWEGCAEEVHIQGLKGCLQFFDKSPPHSALEFPTGLIPPQKPFILDLLSVETLFSERRNCIPSSQNMFLQKHLWHFKWRISVIWCVKIFELFTVRPRCSAEPENWFWKVFLLLTLKSYKSSPSRQLSSFDNLITISVFIWPYF